MAEVVKRIITIDSFIYQIVFDKRIPIIKTRCISSLERSGRDTVIISFDEPIKEKVLTHFTKSDFVTSKVSYEHRGEPWVEQDRGENICFHTCQFSSSLYFLSEEEALVGLEKEKQKVKKQVKSEIEKLNQLINDLS